MDTINNMSTAASQAIWGDQTQDPNIPKTTPRATETGASTLPSSTNTTVPGSTGAYTTSHSAMTGNQIAGREPISGQVGDVRGGEPYDKGNIESSPYTARPSDSRVHAGLGSSTTTGSTTAGPHSSNLANKADPRIDSGLDGPRTAGSTTGGLPSGGSTAVTSSNTDSTGDNGSYSSTTGTNPLTMRSTGDNSNTLSPTHASSLEPPGERKESVAVSPKTVPTTTTAVPGSNLDQEDTSNIGVKFSEQQAPLETRETTTTADNGRPSHSPIFPSGAGVVSGHVDSPMHGAHSHRGTGQFRTTQGTLNARASRDLDDKSHNSLEAHRMDARSKSIAESMHDGKGAEGGMPDVIKKDLEYTKPGQISAEFAGTGGSTAGLDEGSARKVVDSSKTGDSAHHSATGSSTTHPGEKEKMGLGDKIKAKLHHN